MKITIETSDEEDFLRLKRMAKADEAYLAIQDILNEIFRPNRKHGYRDKQIENAVEVANQSSILSQETGTQIPAGEELISLLENKFFNILHSRGISLNDLE